MTFSILVVATDELLLFCGLIRGGHISKNEDELLPGEEKEALLLSEDETDEDEDEDEESEDAKDEESEDEADEDEEEEVDEHVTICHVQV